MKFILSFAFICLLNQAAAPDREFAKEQLVVFIDEEQPVLTPSDKQLLEELAEEQGLTLLIKPIKQGAPKEVTFTPSIFFQNHKGRSFYYGRYKNKSRIKNFVRTSRMVHQGNSDNIKEEIAVWLNGRSTITAPLKLTELTGELPSNFNQTEFIQAAKTTILAGMKDFSLERNFNQSRSTRAFYFNLYPYKSGKNLTITAEIYSQYNCVEPIFKQMETPLVAGKWSQKEALFAQAGKLIEAEIKRQMQLSAIGDAFAPAPRQIPITTWEALGLPLPQKPENTTKDLAQVAKIPKKWRVAPPKDQAPRLIFSFLPPLDNYVGEVQKFDGEMTLGENKEMNGAKGRFEVHIADLTMGEESFDDAVQNKMLKKDNFPASYFIFAAVSGGEKPLSVGTVSKVEIEGSFELLGKKIPLSVPATIEPTIDESGEVRLLIAASFQLSLLESFGLAGPDGPKEASDFLQFYLKFQMTPP